MKRYFPPTRRIWITAILLSGSAAFAARFDITDVSHSNGRSSWATGVNNHAQISGSFWTAAFDRYGYIWHDGLGIRTPDQGAEVNGINEAGDGCGALFLGGAIWNTNGLLITFSSPGVSETGLAINELRQVAGEYYQDWGFSPSYAFVYTGGAAVQPLRFFGQSGEGSARGINDAGHVTGWSDMNGAMHMFIYINGAMIDCGIPDNATESGGYAITNDDRVIGYFVENGVQHAAIYNYNTGQWLALAEQDGATSSVAHAINVHGEIVGSARLADGAWHACLWTTNGAMHNLEAEIPPAAGWRLMSANDINDLGQIVGQGQRGAFGRSFLLTPIQTFPGDLNCDGVISVGDIGPFVLALADPTAYSLQFPNCNIFNGDINNDGTISVGDIGPFVALLTP